MLTGHKILRSSMDTIRCLWNRCAALIDVFQTTKSTSDVSYPIMSGWQGSPPLVMPRHFTGFPLASNNPDNHATRGWRRSGSFDRVPQHATSTSADRMMLSSSTALRGPNGSAHLPRTDTLVVRNAKILPTTHCDPPQRLVNPIFLRVSASLGAASATEGLTPKNAKIGPLGATSRMRQ